MKKIIAISGNGTGAGKTTLANKLADRVYSIAGSMRGELQRRYPEIDWYRKDQAYKETTICYAFDKIPTLGRYGTVREILTYYGQLKCLDSSTYWIDKLVGHLQEAARIADNTPTIAIDDIRKVCELDALKEAFPGRVVHFHVNGAGAKPEALYDNDELAVLCDYEITW